MFHEITWTTDELKRNVHEQNIIIILLLKAQMKCFFIAEFERAAKIRKDRRLPFLNVSSSCRVIMV